MVADFYARSRGYNSAHPVQIGDEPGSKNVKNVIGKVPGQLSLSANGATEADMAIT
jgi:hypothetical protein